MNRQKGVTLTGLLIVSFVIVMVLLLGFRVFPAYLEYSNIQKIFKALSEDPALRTARRVEMDRAWGARATVDDIRSLDGSLIDYTKEGDRWVISAEYSVKLPLFRNVHACIDFKPTSRD